MANDSFFVPAKRKRPSKSFQQENRQPARAGENANEDDEHQMIDVHEMDLRHDQSDHNEESESEEMNRKESAQEKRIRLAKQYIRGIQKSVEEESMEADAAQIDRDLIAERLHLDVLESQGRLKRHVAEKFSQQSLDQVRIVRGHRYSVCCVAITANDEFTFSASKDGTLIKWETSTGKRVHTVKRGLGHSGQILCMSSSSDSQYLATGGSDKKICIWSIAENKLVHTFTQHRDAVTGLAFKRGQNTLFSASKDRTIKVFNIDELAYVETLFGHQDEIMGLCAMGNKDRCLSVGGRDRSVRLWKIIEESQLVFRVSHIHPKRRSKNGEEEDVGDVEDTKQDIIDGLGENILSQDNTGSVDTICWLDDESWITGTDGGVLSQWSIQRKKPVASLVNAHGRHAQVLKIDEAGVQSQTLQINRENLHDPTVGEALHNEELVTNPYWITAIACVPFSDLIVTGSWDGQLRFWQRTDMASAEVQRAHRKSPVKLLKTMSVVGCVNDIKFSASGRYLVVAVGQEHRLGRWISLKEARNSTMIIYLDSLFELKQ